MSTQAPSATDSLGKRAAWCRLQNAVERQMTEGKNWHLACAAQIATILSFVKTGMEYDAAKAEFQKIYDGHEKAYKEALSEAFDAHRDYLLTP